MRGQVLDLMQEIPLLHRLTRLARKFKSPFQRHGNREGGGDAARRRRPQARVPLHSPAANDNPGSGFGAGGGSEVRIEDAVMRLARLIGRQITREQFARPEAANDNAPERDAHDR